MMQTMRHLAQTKVFKGLMMILMVSFALWGIGDIFRGNPLERTVAKAGNVSISVQALDREFNQALSRARQLLGPDLTAQQAKQMGLLDKTLDGMIQRAEVDQALHKLGIKADARMVLDQLAAQPQFRDKDGHFNKALFLRVLDQAGLNERTFIAQGEQDLARRQLIDALSDTGKVPQGMVDALYKARGQKRVLELVTVSNGAMKDIPTPDEKTLRDYYQQNPKPFTAPEYRGITIARLSTADVTKNTTVTEDQVKKEYEARLSQMAQPERRDVLQVVLQDENKARQLAANARKSHDLAAAAKAMGHEAIMLPRADEKTMLPALAKPVFALKPGAISDPIKSSLGWHVMQVTKITPAGTPSFKDVEKQLHDSMQSDQAIDEVTRDVNKLDDELAAGHALEDIADALRLRLIKIPDVDAQGLAPDGKAPPELPNKEDILKTAFSQSSGDISPILDDKNGNYFVVRTDSVKPSAVKPFDQVKDQVEAMWKADQQAKRAAAEAEKIAQGLRDGKPASNFAGNGVEIRTSKPVSMLGDNDPALPPSVLPQVFRLKKGEVTVAMAPGEQIVMRLAQTIEADPSAGQGAKFKITEELKKDSPDELTEEYLRYLRTLFPVEVDQDRLDTIRQQGS